MMKRFSLLFYTGLAIYMLITGCDPRDGELPAWESQFLVPLLNADFDFKDMMLDGELGFSKDSSGGLLLVYVSEEDKVQLIDFLDIPDVNSEFQLPKIPNTIDDFTFAAEINAGDFGVSSGVDVFVPPFTFARISESADLTEFFIEAFFGSGEMALTIQNGFPFIIEQGLIIEVKNSDDGSMLASHTTTRDIAQNGSYTFDPLMDLAGKRMNGKVEVAIRNISSPGAENAEISSENTLGIAFSFSDISFKQATIVIPPFSLPETEEQIVNELPFGAKLTSIHMKSGIVSGIMETNLNFPIEVEVTINKASSSGTVLKTTFDLSNKKTFEIDLKNAIIDLTNNGKQIANTLTVSVKVSSPGSVEPVTVNFEDPIGAELSMSSIVPTAVFGYLGAYQSVLQSGISINLFDRVVSGSINFESPSITAFVNNEIGVTASLLDTEDLYVMGSNYALFPEKEVFLNESLKNIQVKGASTPGGSQLSLIKINEDTEPDFSEFISLLPSKAAFSFPVQIGTSIEDLNQFAIDTSSISGHIEVEFPLAFQSINLTMTDTLNIDVRFDNEYGDILSGELNTYVTNHFPIELLLQVYFISEDLQVLDSMFVTQEVIAAGEVNGQGKVITPSKVNFVIGFSNEKLENLKNASFVKPYFVLNTTQQQYVRVYSDSKVNFKVNGDFLINLESK